MYCKNCGIKLSPNIKYCPNCGTPVVQDKKDYAIASFVLGIISFIPIYGLFSQIVGLVLGFMGLKSSKRNFAIAGIILSSLAIFMTIGLFSIFGKIIKSAHYESKQKDARIQANMNQIRVASQAYYSFHKTYTGFNNYIEEQKIESDIENHGGIYMLKINNDGTGFCATVRMTDGEYWCADGNLKSEKDVDGVVENCYFDCVQKNSCSCD